MESPTYAHLQKIEGYVLAIACSSIIALYGYATYVFLVLLPEYGYDPVLMVTVPAPREVVRNLVVSFFALPTLSSFTFLVFLALAHVHRQPTEYE